MKVLAYGDIMDGGTSVFTSVSKIDGSKLYVKFGGMIRIDNPYNHLESYLNELEALLPSHDIDEVDLDFKDLTFCNSNGFYIIMDISEMIMNNSRGPIVVNRLSDDDWQQETLPILLDVDEPEIAERTTFEDHKAL